MQLAMPPHQQWKTDWVGNYSKLELQIKGKLKSVFYEAGGVNNWLVWFTVYSSLYTIIIVFL